MKNSVLDHGDFMKQYQKSFHDGNIWPCVKVEKVAVVAIYEETEHIKAEFAM